LHKCPDICAIGNMPYDLYYSCFMAVQAAAIPGGIHFASPLGGIGCVALSPHSGRSHPWWGRLQSK
ncbi:MAG TPA: hypothetical protein VFD72_03750, partial [Sphingobacteriaceae bacterium]|nr:hypothetical protein [Sphingobacteriaceae bacterium]